MATKLYCTKYVLTKGILDCDTPEDLDTAPKTWLYTYLKDGEKVWGLMGKDFFLTLEEAKEDRLLKAKRKLKSLNKQVSKMKAIIAGE